jgi:iron complex outermembrane receptor protein
MKISISKFIPRSIQIIYSLFFLPAIVCTGSVAAQEAASESLTLEEVLVTATKREENIQDIPISISVMSSEEVDAISAGGADIRILRGRLPSLNIESSFGRIFPRFYIRGWGNTDFDYNASQPVSLIYDEVVQESPVLKGFPMFDIARVEVLRGPQGTLFGRNTTVGIVKIDSVKPSQETDGYATLSYGSFGSLNLEGAVGGGLGESWSGRISAKYMSRDDWVDNAFTGEKDVLEGFDEWAVRAQLLYDAGGSFTALFNVHYRDLDGTARLFRANIIELGSNEFSEFYDHKTVEIDGTNIQDVEAWGAIANLSWALGRTTFTSITGYETFESFSRGDIDGGWGAIFVIGEGGPGFNPLDGETADGVPDHSQFTQEFRLISNDWGKFDWVTGFYYFEDEITIDTINYAVLFGGDPNGLVLQQQDTKAWAVFGSIDYDFTDRTFLKVGLRYSDDDKDFVAERFLSPLSFLGVPPIGPIPAKVSDSEVTWDVSLTQAVSDTVSVFGRVAKGFRAPSIQGRLLFGDTVSIADSEKSHSLDIGVKSILAEGRVRLNANLFTYKIDDAQVTAVGGASNFNQVINANKVEGSGFEADLQAYVTDNFLLTAVLSYNKTKIKDPDLSIAPCGSALPCTVLDPPDPNVPGAVLIDGNKLPQAPKWVGSFTARWSKQMQNGEFYIFADYFSRSSVNFFLYESEEYTGKKLAELGLRVGYIWGLGRHEAALFGRNVTDEEVIVGGLDFLNQTGFINEPRIWGAEYRINF